MSTGLQPAWVLSPGADLTGYTQTVSNFPILSAEEEQRLAEDLYYNGNVDAARELVLAHLRFVVHIARSYNGYGLPLGDLIQEGNVGLMKAVRRFDPERGVRLVSFAVHWIKAEIHEYVVRNWRLVKVATTKAQRKLFFNLRRLRPDGETLGPEQVNDIATELDVRPEDVSEMEVRMSGQEMAFDPSYADDENNFAPSSWLAAEGQEPSKILEQRDHEMLQTEGIAKAL